MRKSIYFKPDVWGYISHLENVSSYINNLIRQDMKQISLEDKIKNVVADYLQTHNLQPQNKEILDGLDSLMNFE